MDPSSDPDDSGQVGSAALVGRWVLKRIRVLITLTLLGGLIVWQIPGLLVQVGEKIRQDVMPSLGWGLVVVLVVYMGAFLVGGLVFAAAIFFGVITLGELSKVILTVGFSSLGLVLAGFGLLVNYGSKLVVSYLVGRLLLKWLAPSYDDQPIWAMLLGVFLYAFLRAIPGLGFLIGVAATLIGIGAMWLIYRDKFPGKTAAPEIPATE